MVPSEVMLLVDGLVDGMETEAPFNMQNMTAPFFVGSNSMRRGFRGEVYNLVVNNGDSGNLLV